MRRFAHGPAGLPLFFLLQCLLLSKRRMFIITTLLVVGYYWLFIIAVAIDNTLYSSLGLDLPSDKVLLLWIEWIHTILFPSYITVVINSNCYYNCRLIMPCSMHMVQENDRFVSSCPHHRLLGISIIAQLLLKM